MLASNARITRTAGAGVAVIAGQAGANTLASLAVVTAGASVTVITGHAIDHWRERANAGRRIACILQTACVAAVVAGHDGAVHDVAEPVYAGEHPVAWVTVVGLGTIVIALAHTG